MRLKRLELFGFKSFADRTVLDFDGNSLTGIVGPNGCGKSNVVDAIRWVLGETRPTSMRGSGMTDVIFKGSTSRPAMSVSEVTIVLDNADGEFEDHGSEVSITRRLFRSGEGEYMIDSQRVRLKDVRDLLYDTGLGSRGYSVLEQGRIDAVLSANPIQRRSVFEEAAGISRYRQRRHEAELKLKRVEQDVSRLDDVMGELRTRVRSLKIQAGKAERFVQARDEWRSQRGRFLRHRLHAIDGELGEIGPAVEALEQQLSDLREMRAACEAEIDAGEKERASVVSELERLSGEAARVAGEGRAMDERKSQLGLRISAWQQTAEEESARAERLSTQLAEHGQELASLSAELEELRGATSAAETEVGAVGSRLRDANQRYKTVRADVQTQNDLVLEKLHERTAAQNRARHLEESRDPAHARLAHVGQRMSTLDASIATVAGEGAEAEARVETAQTALLASEERRDARRSELGRLEQERETQRKRREECELERARLSSRVESLLDRERELEDLGAGTRDVLGALDTHEAPCLSEELSGLVADHLQVDTRLARALDVVLDERAHALVARDAGVSRRIVDWLGERRNGQVGVVALGGLGRDERTPPSDFAEFGGRVEGRFCDIVRCEPHVQSLARTLLGDVFVVRDLDLAVALVERFPAWRFVTPRGELVDAAGLVGGHREVTQGAIGRRSSAAEIEGEIALLGTQIEDVDRLLAEHDERAERLRAELTGVEEELEGRRAALSDVQGELRAARARHEDLEASRTLLARELAKAEDEIEGLEADIVASIEGRRRAEEAFEVENGRLATMEEGRRALEAQREELAREQSRTQVELTRVRGELATTEHKNSDLRRRISEVEAEIERSRKLADESHQNASSAASEAEQIAEQASRLLADRGALEQKLEELRAFERSGRERVEEFRGKAETVVGRLDRISDDLSERRLAEQRLQLAREELIGRGAEELELDEADLTLDFVPDEELATRDALAALERRVTELKGQLDRMGPVNTEAVDELEEVGGRLEFLETQSGDLAQSRQTLREAIRKIDEESKRLFLETFHEVRENFQRIFRQLFGGGRADVKLEEDVDVLEAGIEIVARPPGRELLSIGLLSGGQRTMTALALLFAVFEARPSPFCVLDEVDAALDDANIDRFIAMLDGFRKGTQFIVVTHNKGSMVACDALYGVTMEVKGVSRFVSVELDDVDQFTPDEAAAPEAATAEPTPSEAGTSGAIVERGGGSALDSESGEPLVEIVPARQGASDDVAPEVAVGS